MALSYYCTAAIFYADQRSQQRVFCMAVRTKIFMEPEEQNEYK